MSSYNNPYFASQNTTYSAQISSPRLNSANPNAESAFYPPSSFTSYDTHLPRGSDGHTLLPPLPPSLPSRFFAVPPSPSGRQPLSRLQLPPSHPMTRFVTLLQTTIVAHQRKAVQLRRVAALCHYRWLLSDRSIDWVENVHTQLIDRHENYAPQDHTHTHATVGGCTYSIRQGEVMDPFPLSLATPISPTGTSGKRKKSRPLYSQSGSTFSSSQPSISTTSHPESSTNSTKSQTTERSTAKRSTNPVKPSTSTSPASKTSTSIDDGARALAVQLQWLLSELWRVRALQAGVHLQLRLLTQRHWAAVLDRVRSMQAYVGCH